MKNKFTAPRFLFAVLLASVHAGAQPYTDVPFVPTPPRLVDAMLDLAGIGPHDVLVDLGSGDGRIVVEAAKRFGIRATGVEIDPELVRQSQALARKQGVSDKVRFVEADLFTYDLRDASVVALFLTPGVNLRLRPKLLRELKPGARVVSHRFDLGSWTPARTVRVDDDPLFLWVVPEQGHAPELRPPPLPQAPPFEQLAALFAYDSSAPLQFHPEEAVRLDRCSLAAVSYAGGRGPVSATLVTPAASGKHPAVIFVPDYGRRDEFLPEALALAQAPPAAVSLLVDPPPERPLGWRRAFNSLAPDDNDRQIHIQAVVDIRRAVDLLSARPDVDPARIAYVGHGYGANWGAILASLEPRLRAFVLVAGVPSLAEVMQGDDPDWANVRNALGPERFARYRDTIATVDPIRYTPYWAGQPILFQFGRFDPFVAPAMAERLANSLPRPQKAVFYAAGHSVNAPAAVRDRDAFLARAIGTLRPPLHSGPKPRTPQPDSR